MLILGLLGMYFDAVVAEVKTCLLLFRLALAILCDPQKLLQYDFSTMYQYYMFFRLYLSTIILH